MNAKCLDCGTQFAVAANAARHYRDAGHVTWSIPSSWFDGRPWTPVPFFHSILREADEVVLEVEVSPWRARWRGGRLADVFHIEYPGTAVACFTAGDWDGRTDT